MGRRNGWFRPWLKPKAAKRRREKRREPVTWTDQLAKAMRNQAAANQEVCDKPRWQTFGLQRTAEDEAAGCPAADDGPRNCGRCRFRPLRWQVGDHPKVTTGECEHPEFVFPRIITAVDGQYWTAGRLLNCGCRAWQREDV